MKIILGAFLVAFPALVRAQALPYHSIIVSTTAGTAAGNLSGTFYLAASSLTYSTPTMVLDGISGGVNVSSLTAKYAIIASTGLFTNGLTAGSIATTSETITSSSFTVIGYLGMSKPLFGTIFNNGNGGNQQVYVNGVPSDVNASLSVTSTLLTAPNSIFYNAANTKIAQVSDISGSGIVDVYNAGSLADEIVANGNTYFNGGNVGIETASPVQPLEVNGNAQIDQSLIVNGSSISIQSITSPILALTPNDQNAASRNWAVLVNNITYGDFSVVRSRAIHGNATGGPATADDLLEISAAGNVGIGTTNPISPLHVIDNTSNGIILQRTSGTARTWNQLILSNGSWDLYDQTAALDRLTIDTSGNAVLSSSVTASAFFGDGSHLTGISATFNGGTVANETDFLSSVTFQSASGVAITSITALNETTFTISGSSFSTSSRGTSINITGGNGSGGGTAPGGGVLIEGGNGAIGPSSGGGYTSAPGNITLQPGTAGSIRSVSCQGASGCLPAVNVNGQLLISSPTLNLFGANPVYSVYANSGGLTLDSNNTLDVTGKITVGTINSNSSTALTVYGVITSSTTSPTVTCTAGAPTMTVGSTSQAGSYAAGALATSCTVTFAQAFPKAPFCMCQAFANLLVYASATATNSVTCTSATAMTGDTIGYHCFGPP